jgi:hypothetical protein
MIYVCAWRRKRSQGTIEVDTHNATEARKRARAIFRDNFGLRVKIVWVQPWTAGKVKEKSK